MSSPAPCCPQFCDTWRSPWAFPVKAACFFKVSRSLFTACLWQPNDECPTMRPNHGNGIALLCCMLGSGAGPGPLPMQGCNSLGVTLRLLAAHRLPCVGLLACTVILGVFCLLCVCACLSENSPSHVLSLFFSAFPVSWFLDPCPFQLSVRPAFWQWRSSGSTCRTDCCRQQASSSLTGLSLLLIWVLEWWN